MFIDGNHLDIELVANLDHVIDLADVFVVQLADVAQTIPAGDDLDESAEVLDRGDLTLVDLADAHLLT